MDLKRIVSWLLLLSLVGIALACSSRANQVAPALPKEEAKQPVATKAAWETEWDKTVLAARKEGKVVINVTSLGPALKEQSALIKEKFGITLEIITRRGGELMTTFIAERRAGIYTADILITGTNTFFGETEPAGLVDPLEPVIILPEILDGKNWYGGKVHWADADRKAIHMYAYPNSSLARNTDLVKDNEIKSYLDTLNPKFKGKIIMNDPTIAGTGLKSFSALGFNIINLDFFSQLAKQEPIIIRDQRLQVNWLAQGKYSLLFFPRTSDMTEFQEAGAPVAYLMPVEGTYLSRNGGALSIVNRAAHPNAARVMVNWIMSKEGLALISKAHGLQTARVDVPVESADPLKIRQPGVKYFTEADSKEWVARDNEFKKAALDIFGQYIK